MTELASGAIMQSTPSQSKLSEADETAAIVIVGWPAKATVIHPCRSSDADTDARVFAAAVVKTAQLRRQQGL